MGQKSLKYWNYFYACLYGRLDLLPWLCKHKIHENKNRPEGRFIGPYAAAKGARVDIIEWIREYNIEPLNYSAIADNGIMTVKFAYANGGKHSLRIEACSEEIRQWLVENGEYQDEYDDHPY